MANVKAQVETSDTKGSTVHYDGTVGLAPIQIPDPAANIIAEFWIENDISNSPAQRKLSFSCDGGVTYTELNLSEGIGWTPKGDVRQIYIKGSAVNVKYKMIVNFEEY